MRIDPYSMEELREFFYFNSTENSERRAAVTSGSGSMRTVVVPLFILFSLLKKTVMMVWCQEEAENLIFDVSMEASQRIEKSNI